jgi:hypothetical protein
MLAQAPRYQVEGGSLAGKESSEAMSTISRTGMLGTQGAAKAQSSMVDPAALQPISHSDRRRVPAATIAAPTAAQTSLAPRFNASLFIDSSSCYNLGIYTPRPIVRFDAGRIR